MKKLFSMILVVAFTTISFSAIGQGKGHGQGQGQGHKKQENVQKQEQKQEHKQEHKQIQKQDQKEPGKLGKQSENNNVSRENTETEGGKNNDKGNLDKKPNEHKEFKGKGNAYGRNKGEMSGREFGQMRSEEAKNKVNNKLQESDSRLNAQQSRVNTMRQNCDNARKSNEEKYKAGKNF